MEKPSGWTDFRLEQVIGNLLRGGVLLAGTVVLAGGVLYLLHHGMEHRDYRTFHGMPENLKNVTGIFQGALALNSEGIIQLGLLLLVLTPISRVAFSALGFLLERDRLYVGLTLIVLGVLLFSLFRAV